MTLLFCDGADHYTSNAAAMNKWTGGTSNAGGGMITGAAGSGRFSGGAISMNGGSGSGQGYKQVAAPAATMIFGFALTLSSWASATICQIYLGPLTTLHVDLRTDSIGRLFVTRNGTQLGSTSSQLLASGWHYFEVKVLIDDTVGTVEVRLDGNTTPIINLTGQDTRNAGASATCDCLSFPVGAGVTRLYDDVYICDTAGSVNNDFLGDIRVIGKVPDGNGASSAFVGSDADSTDNYLLVDETAPNDDTDYVEASTVGNKDTYAYAALGVTGTVRAVAIYSWARKTSAGARSIVNVARASGGTEEDSATARVLTASYTYAQEIRETKPGGGAWAVSDVDGAEFGVKVSA